MSPTVVTNGTLLTERVTVKLLEGAGQTNVDITLSYPAGVAYDSHVVSHGAFADPVWTLLTVVVGNVYTLDVTVEVTDIDAFTASDRTITATTPELPSGEPDTGNNTLDIVIQDIITCPELTACVNPNIHTIDDGDSPYTIIEGHNQIIFIDNSAGAVIVNFPPAADMTGQTFTVFVKDDPSAFSVTIEPDGAETIQIVGGAPVSNLTVSLAGEIGTSLTITSDGSNLFVI